MHKERAIVTNYMRHAARFKNLLMAFALMHVYTYELEI